MFGGALYYTADVPSTGRELLRLDAGGSVSLVADLMPGPGSGLADLSNQLKVAQGRLYFVGDDGVTGRELLWTTGAGAQQLIDLMPLSYDANPVGLTPLPNNAMLFIANGPGVGRELWTTDGTSAGTQLVANLAPESGGDSSEASLGSELIADALYLRATTTAEGAELHRLNVTTGQVDLVADIDTTFGVSSLDQSNPLETATILVGGQVRTFFAASRWDLGLELFMTDGTAGGTQLVRDLFPGDIGSRPKDLTAAGERVFFSARGSFAAGRELWVTDGTFAGTVQVADLNPVGATGQPKWMVALGDRVVFNAETASFGEELWISDGTPAGTQLRADIWPGTASGFTGAPVRIGDQVYFAGSNATLGGNRVWVTDGTPGGTHSVTNTYVQPYFAGEYEWTFANGQLYLVSSDAQHGVALWSLDLVTEQLSLLVDLSPTLFGIGPTLVEPANGGLFIAERADTTPFAGGLYFWSYAQPPHTPPLNLLGGGTLEEIGNLHAVGAGVYFTATTAATGNELYYSDGTLAGTGLVCDLRPGAAGSAPADLRSADGILYLTADDGVTGRELYRLAVGQATAPTLAIDDALGTLRITPPVLGSSAQVDLVGITWNNVATASLVATLSGTQALSVPATPTLAGVRLHVQAYSLTPTEIEVSNGVRLQLGL